MLLKRTDKFIIGSIRQQTKRTLDNFAEIHVAKRKSSLTFQLGDLDRKHVQRHQLQQPVRGDRDRRVLDQCPELPQHLDGAGRERLHAGFRNQLPEHVQEAHDEPLVQFDRIELAQFLFLFLAGVPGPTGHRIQWRRPVHPETTLRMDPRFAPQVPIEAVLFFFEPGPVLLLPLPLAALVLHSAQNDDKLCQGKRNKCIRTNDQYQYQISQSKENGKHTHSVFGQDRCHHLV